MLKSFIKHFFSKSNYIYTSLFLYILRAIFPYFTFTERFFTLLLGWGILLIIYDLFTKRSLLKFYGNYILTLLLFSVFITSILHIDSLYSNLYTFVGMAIVFYCIYTKDANLNYKKEVYTITIAGTSVLSLANIVSLGLALFGVSIPYKEGTTYIRTNFIGISDRGQFSGLYGNPNYNAWYSLLGLFLCLVLWHSIKNKKTVVAKVLLFFNMGLFMLTIFYTQSRGALLGLLVGIFIYSFLYMYQKLSFKVFLKSLLSLSVAVIFCFATYYGRNFLVNKTLSNTQDPNPNGGNNVNIISRDDENKALNTSARLCFFKISANIALKNGPLFGIGNSPDAERTTFWLEEANIVAKENPSLKNILTKAVGQTHNLFFALLLNNGIVAVLIFVCFLLYCLRKICIILSNKYDKPKDFMFGVSLLTACFSIFTIAMFENILLYPTHNALEIIAFSFLGVFFMWVSDSYGVTKMQNKAIDKANLFLDSKLKRKKSIVS